MKEDASVTESSTSNIVTRNISGLSEEELIRLPDLETMRRDVRRNRSSVTLNTPRTNDRLFNIPYEMKTLDTGNKFFIQNY